MAGEAKTDNFMLGTAEVMIGRQADLHDLNPETHSIGLVKNFSNEAQKETTDLTQGITNDIVYTVTTGSPVRMSCEMYEYTDKNMSYALSLDGASLQELSGDVYTTTADGAANTDPNMTDLTVDTPSSPDTISAGDTVVIKVPNGNVILGTANDTINANTLTINQAIATPNTAIPTGSTVAKVNLIALGDDSLPEYYAVKVVGQLANGKTVTFLYPKVGIASGLSLVFSSQDFNNIPFEMTAMALLKSDPFYAEFTGKKAKMAIN